MNIKEQIMADVKVAMKSRQPERLTTLRFIHSAIKNKEIDSRPNEVSETDMMAVLKKMAKQRKDSIEQFQNAGRDDLVSKEQAELLIIQEYLPESLSLEKVEEVVAEAISECQATSLKDMGKVMKAVTEKTQGAADSKIVSQIVKSKLQ